MKKSRGQSLIDFVVLTVLAVGIILFGIYQFGDDLANLFARSDVENKFNNARTVRYEKPEDIISNVTVTFDGIPIKPPVSTVLAQDLASGTYIQTSGSSGRIAQMAEITKEYVNQLTNLITGGGAGDTLKTALNDYKDSLSNGVDGFLDKHETFTVTQVLEKKANLIKMSASVGVSGHFDNIQSALDNYLPTISGSDPVRHDIIESFTNDLLGFDNSMDYFIDPLLYVEYLAEEKRNDPAQDVALLEAIETAAATLTQEEKQNIADLMKMYYGSSYSKVSPGAYNGMQMCNTFGGTYDADSKSCTISGP